MQLPAYKKKKKRKTKYCSYTYDDGKVCEKQFIGHVIAKYCNFHSDPRNRRKKKKLVVDKTLNIKVEHNYKKPTDVNINCHVPGCGKMYTLKLIPKLAYPYQKWCEEHISRHRRELFMRQTGQDSKLLETIVEYSFLLRISNIK